MVLIIYDSNYGNTKQIAEAIAETLGEHANCVSVDNFQPSDLVCDFIIVGCPINAWHPTPKTAAFLKSLAPSQLAGKKGAAFDTRIKSFFSGNAARKVAKALRGLGVDIVVPPMGFYVKGKEGPLLEGEIARAIAWTKTIMARL